MEVVANVFERGLGRYSVCEWDVFPSDVRAYVPVQEVQETVEPQSYTVEAEVSAPTQFEYVFLSLAEKWIAETSRSSLVGKRYSHPAYKALLEFGRLSRNEAITVILKELKNRPDRWFDALRTLSQENPASEAKSFDESVQRWLEWGAEHGFLD